MKDLVEVKWYTLVDSSLDARMTGYFVILNEVKDLVEVKHIINKNKKTPAEIFR